MNSKLVAKYMLLQAPSKHENWLAGSGGILGPGPSLPFLSDISNTLLLWDPPWAQSSVYRDKLEVAD